MSPMADIDVTTDEWVHKLHFDNRIELNLQIPASGESKKIEVSPEHIPQLGLPSFGDKEDFTSLWIQHKQNKSAANTIPTNDSYLHAIVSSSKKATNSNSTTSNVLSCQGTKDCPCYKCQRQRRRAGTRGRIISTEPSSTTPKLKNDTYQTLSRYSSSDSLTSTEQPTTPKPTVTRNGSFVLRKKPSSTSYERHLPRPTYSELDSIYREQPSNNKSISINSSHSQHNFEQYNNDPYELSWQDETDDDILTSLRTFQTIFEENPHRNEGLSDLLEIRAQELRLQKILEQERQAMIIQQQQAEPTRPPKRSDCLTLSYRDGPEHKHLTLYHTMKMTGPNERMAAYSRAFQHCIHADSGLGSYIENQLTHICPSAIRSNHQPNLTLKKSTKMSLLPFPGRKQQNTAEDLWLRTNKLGDSFHLRRDSVNTVEPIDVLHTANALMPASSSIHPSIGRKNAKPYDSVDIPSRPLPRNRNSVDDSLASFDMEPHDRSTKSRKIWTTLGRKASRSRSSTSSNHSIEKAFKSPSILRKHSESFKEALDNLCRAMPHVDPSVLKSYLEQSNGDYMKALSVIRADVTYGRL